MGSFLDRGDRKPRRLSQKSTNLTTRPQPDQGAYEQQMQQGHATADRPDETIDQNRLHVEHDRQQHRHLRGHQPAGQRAPAEIVEGARRFFTRNAPE